MENNIQINPFSYDLEGNYQAITEHPKIVTYTTNTVKDYDVDFNGDVIIKAESVKTSESIDTSYYVLKDKANTFEAINRLGYFEALMKKYKVKGIAELELMIETYIDERGEY